MLRTTLTAFFTVCLCALLYWGYELSNPHALAIGLLCVAVCGLLAAVILLATPHHRIYQSFSQAQAHFACHAATAFALFAVQRPGLAASWLLVHFALYTAYRLATANQPQEQ